MWNSLPPREDKIHFLNFCSVYIQNWGANLSEILPLPLLVSWFSGRCCLWWVLRTTSTGGYATTLRPSNPTNTRYSQGTSFLGGAAVRGICESRFDVVLSAARLECLTCRAHCHEYFRKLDSHKECSTLKAFVSISAQSMEAEVLHSILKQPTHPGILINIWATVNFRGRRRINTHLSRRT